MNNNQNIWRNWWNNRANSVSSDYELDRITAFQDNKIKLIDEKEFSLFLNPDVNDVVFDAGCGTGHNIKNIFSNVKLVVGMDISEKMLFRANETLKNHNIKNSYLMVGEISNIGLKNNTFNKILCMSVLHYLNDDECIDALKEFRRISKEGAVIIFHVKNLLSIYLFTLFVFKKIKYIFINKPINVENYRTFMWYKKMFSDNGMKILDYNSVNKFNIDIFPYFIFKNIQYFEEIFYRRRYLRKYGADLKIKVLVN